LNPLDALVAVIQSLLNHALLLKQKKTVDAAAISAISDAVNNADTAVAAVLSAPDPGPRTDLDFTLLDAAVLAFKSSSAINQDGANAIAQLITMNIPKG
jgi:hypothetical protein